MNNVGLNMEKAQLFLKTEPHMKANGTIIKCKDMVYFSMKIKIYMKENL